jgi:hypothetical protein
VVTIVEENARSRCDPYGSFIPARVGSNLATCQ